MGAQRKLRLSPDPTRLQGPVANRDRALTRTISALHQDAIDLSRVVKQLETALTPFAKGLLNLFNETHLEMTITRRIDATCDHASLPLLELFRREKEL